MEEIYIVTVIEEYEILSQCAFRNKKHAEKKLDELYKKYFYNFSKDYLNYQDTSEWWDDDCRIKVFMEILTFKD